MKKKKYKFLRRKWYAFSKLGRGRKKKQVWRKSKGRHAKIREKRKSYPKMPSPGFKHPLAERGMIQGKKPVIVQNIKDILKIKKNEIAVMSSNTGSLKRYEIAKKASELNINFSNFDSAKFLNEFKFRGKKTEEKK